MVSVQCCKLFAIVPCKGVSGVAMVTPDPQLVEVGLGLQSEASILCKHLPAGPVLQRDEQFVVSLVGQPVDVLQPQPVLTVYVAKTLLWRGKQKIRKSCFENFQILFWISAGPLRVSAQVLGIVMGGQCVVYCQGELLYIKFAAHCRRPEVHCYFIYGSTAGYIACRINLTCWIVSNSFTLALVRV